MSTVFDGQTKCLIVRANTPDYLDADRFAIEPVMPDGVEHKHLTVVAGRDLTFKGSVIPTGAIVEMSQAEKDVVDGALVPAAKTAKKNAIDARTDAIIAGGFDYDGHHFSLSVGAQMNLVGLQKGIDAGAIMFPHKISTDDDSVEYSIPDEATYTTIYLLGVGAIKTAMDSGRVLKLAVAACTTLAEVEAVEDLR